LEILRKKKKKKKVKKMSNNFNFEDWKIKEENELKAIATAITNNKYIPIEITTEKEAYTDFNKISIGIDLLPKGIKLNSNFAKKLLNGLCLHEGGHNVISKMPYRYYKAKERNLNFIEIWRYITNLIEDLRVDYYIQNRYRYDLGKDLTFTLNELGKSFKLSILSSVDKLNTIERIINYILFKTKFNINLYNELGIYGIRAFKDYEKEVFEILEKVKYTNLYNRLLEYAKRLYDILILFIENEGDNYDNIPNIIGGLIEPLLTEEQKKEIEKEEKEGKEKYSKGGKKVSRGLGLEIPAPKPDIREYEKIVKRVKNEINRLLNLLKKTQTWINEKKDYQKYGRLMSKIISKAYVNSLRNRVENIHTLNINKPKEQKIFLAILVDLSSSVNTYEAMKSLTIFSEVASKWLNDSEFCIIVYGENYMKIKTFYEKYDNVKGRIGGLTNLGGTKPYEPIVKILELFQNLKGRKKLLIHVSDFEFYSKEEIEQIKSLNYKDIEVINLCYSYGILKNAKEISKNSITIESIKELPEKFIQIYRTLF
jgi:hypothetical protein